ncbi:MAG: leucine-rich repeat domain-containing protein, partial [Clostridia bacterium]|nr:leucine-rich repeat domain-containing protein [Clostridia bacterium]
MKRLTLSLLIILLIFVFLLTSCGCKHEKKILEKKDATCYETGLTEGECCTLCGEILKEQEIIPKLTHNYVDGICTYCNTANPLEALEFKLSEDGSYYIITGVGKYTSELLVIPTEYNEKPVKEIAAEAFLRNKTITKLVIPNGIQKVGDKAFSESDINELDIQSPDIEFGVSVFERSGIKAVKMHEDTKIIASNMFARCGGLKSFTIGNKIETIYGGAFSYSGLEKIVIPANVTQIGQMAFKYCENLTEVEFNEGLTAIYDQAFFGCSKIEKIVLPNSLTTLSAKAFYSCGYLKEVVIGDGLEKISREAFSGCDCDKVTIGKKVNFIGE